MSATLEQLNREVKAGGAYKYVIVKAGKLTEIEIEREDTIVPDEEMYRCLEFYGVATETYPVTFEGETSTKIGLLLRIVDENDPQHKGIFLTSATFESVGPKSTMGQIVAAILGEPFTGTINDEFWLSVLGGRFGATLNLKVKADRTYVNLVHGSFKPARTKTAAKPAGKTAPATDPFADDDEEE